MQIKTRLGGGKTGDPSVYIDIIDRKRAILFDCGLHNFRHGQLRKVSDLFVSHTHIDHFIGFDALLRLNLVEVKTLRVYGPPGITQNVRGKLQGYTWNICQNLQLFIHVSEILPDKIVATTFRSNQAFAVSQVREYPHSNILLDTREFAVRYIQLDHKTPSFGYTFIEADRFNVQKEQMQALNLTPGPWVAELKRQADDPISREQHIKIKDRSYSVGYLTDTLLVRKQGIKITYLTDCLFDRKSLEVMAEFAWKSDILFCEAAFLDRDREKACRTYHLTAKEAGIIARHAQVQKLVLFHFSKRYQDLSLLLEEAATEFPHVE